LQGGEALGRIGAALGLKREGDRGPDMSTEGMTAPPEEGARSLDTPIQRPDMVTEGYTVEGPQAQITPIPEAAGPNVVTMDANPKKPPDIGQFADPSNVPSPWEWRGNPNKIGRREGAWYNPVTGESLHDDRTHPEGKSPHWTYQDAEKNRWDAPDDDRENWTPQE